MVYFSNGSEGCSFESNVCGHCVHYEKDEETQTWGCPVFDVHFLFNSEQLTDGKKNSIGNLLTMLITDDWVCKMRIANEPPNDTPDFVDGLAG